MHRAGDPRATRAGRALTRHRHGDTLQEQGGIEGDRSPAARAQPRTVGHGTGGRRRLRCCVGVQRREMRWTACTHARTEQSTACMIVAARGRGGGAGVWGHARRVIGWNRTAQGTRV